ncbi:ATXN3_1 [Blepharisma stoltei]|uniref:ubiquitinyl hydrolase 1 n=1 Tax=Blepharisma stoltei TaxID=1481888 RepID=A0AAU9JBU1_9CILI|nr:unnamed protein product [Blepharisma stoltei]
MSDYIYWERQSFNLLCGVHALNSLLQGPYFTKKKLDKISKELDNEEKALFESYNTSENFDETGFYSIQVMSKALLSKGFDCSHYTTKQFEKWDEQNESAFLLHVGLHWIAVRKIGVYWYVLNSLRPLGPQALSETGLQENIRSTLKNQSYCWFLVSGEFKNYNFSKYSFKRGQFLIPAQEILRQNHTNAYAYNPAHAYTYSPTHTWDSASQQSYILNMLMNGNQSGEFEFGFSPESMVRTKNESLIAQRENLNEKSPHKSKRKHINHKKQEDQKNNDSLDDEDINIRLCLPNLEFISQRFKSSNTLNDILKWAMKESSYKNLKLFLDYPKRVFKDTNSKIKDAGISSKCNVIYSES